MRREILGVNEGGVISFVDIANDGSELVARDWQSKETNQIIADSAAEHRNSLIGGRKTKHGGFLAARVPITIWTNWRREWMEKHRDKMLWATFELTKIADRNYEQFRATNYTLPTKHLRERPLEW